MELKHKARKRFGQNFLNDFSVIENILGSLQLKDNEHFVEIGPGKGALTEPLIASGVQLDIIEIDRDLIAFLKQKYHKQENLRIFSSDALKFDYESLRVDKEKIRIIGNLPYNISTPLLFHLFKNTSFIEDMHFMLQKELVNRICANPGTKKYGRLTVMSQYYCSAESLFDVPPESFDPAPKVDSAVIKFIPHETPPVKVNSIAVLNKVVTQAFSQRRKTLRNSLKSLIAESEIEALSIDPTLRAESISLEGFAKLSNLMTDR